MFNVCESCGAYRPDKEIDPTGPWAICPDCGRRHAFLRLPFLCLIGASGTGKTTVCLRLAREARDVVVMESDILWRSEFDSQEMGGLEYRNTWLRVCKNIGQAGRPVLLCGSASPGQFEPCVEARYFSGIHYLALVCDERALADRLSQRPSWRQSSRPEFLQAHLDWNRWFKTTFGGTQHVHDVTLLDTTDATVGETVEAVYEWIKSKRIET